MPIGGSAYVMPCGNGPTRPWKIRAAADVYTTSVVYFHTLAIDSCQGPERHLALADAVSAGRREVLADRYGLTSSAL
jgi:hypothetical protein